MSGIDFILAVAAFLALAFAAYERTENRRLRRQLDGRDLIRHAIGEMARGFGATFAASLTTTKGEPWKKKRLASGPRRRNAKILDAEILDEEGTE